MIRSVKMKHRESGYVVFLETALNDEFLLRMYPDWEIIPWTTTSGGSD